MLSLWKFLHISQIQEECGISDSAVDDIAPMATSETNSSEKGRRPQEEDVLSIAKLVQVGRELYYCFYFYFLQLVLIFTMALCRIRLKMTQQG